MHKFYHTKSNFTQNKNNKTFLFQVIVFFFLSWTKVQPRKLEGLEKLIELDINGTNKKVPIISTTKK